MKSISDAIIDRGVELWCRSLRTPSFNNGDESIAGAFTRGLHAVNMARDISVASDIDMAIDRFRIELSAQIKAKRDEGKNVFVLHSDYGPDKELYEAAVKSGVPLKLFSWKSQVYLGRECVSASFGYAEEDRNHYPLSDGSWLICSLRGEDMPKIIEAVEAGLLTTLTIERQSGQSSKS